MLILIVFSFCFSTGRCAELCALKSWSGRVACHGVPGDHRSSLHDRLWTLQSTRWEQLHFHSIACSLREQKIIGEKQNDLFFVLRCLDLCRYPFSPSWDMLQQEVTLGDQPGQAKVLSEINCSPLWKCRPKVKMAPLSTQNNKSLIKFWVCFIVHNNSCLSNCTCVHRERNPLICVTFSA